MNKKGFISTSVIFAFFITFLMLLVIIIASYGQNRILMNQVKKDIKSNLVIKYNMVEIKDDEPIIIPEESVDIGCELTKDEDSDGEADIGDMVNCGETENFYVYSNDGSTIKMLAQYNLYIGGEYDSTTSTYTPYGSDATGLQNINMKGVIDSSALRKGITVFSSDNIKGVNYSSYDGSIVQDYVNLYANKLTEKGVNAKEVTLITKEEIDTIAGKVLKHESVTSWAPTWLYQTSYWTRSAYDEEDMWVLSTYGIIFYRDNYTSDYGFGVRPVVVISADGL